MDNKQKLKQLKRAKYKSERSQKYNFPDDTSNISRQRFLIHKIFKGLVMKIDDEYGLVASDEELNIYRRLDRQQKYNKKHKKASKRKSNTDKRKDAFYDDRKWR